MMFSCLLKMCWLDRKTCVAKAFRTSQDDLTGLNSCGQSGLCVLGYMCLNHVMASSVCLESTVEDTLSRSFGVRVGKKHQRLCPEIRAFQAEVPRGSMWIPVPERGGPMTTHL